MDAKLLTAIGTHLHYQRISPTHYMLPNSQPKYDAAMAEALNFPTKEAYLVWTEKWIADYQVMTKDARTDHTWTRQQRNAMMHIRTEAKKKSWAMKLARLINS